MVVPDAPVRALVVFGDGLMEYISPAHSHLQALAASGACGFLALRHGPPHMNDLSRSIFEMQQLLDVHQFGKINTNETSIKNNNTCMEMYMPSIAERFMGMKAALITNSEPIANLGERLGFTVCNSNVGLSFTEPPTSNTAPYANVASELLQLLGLGDTSPSKGSNNYELVLLHVTGGCSMDRDGVSRAYVDWIDDIIGEVKTLMRPGTKANDHLYLALVLSYGAEAASQSNLAHMELHVHSVPTNMRALRPEQTYKMKDGKPVDGVRDHHPMLVVHQMDGVTRRDSVISLGFEEFLKGAGDVVAFAGRLQPHYFG